MLTLRYFVGEMASVDQERIKVMYRLGYFTKAQIARRLKCSYKTVQRILDNEPEPVKWMPGFVETEFEIDAWYGLYVNKYLVSEIAYHFGVSRKAVWSRVPEMEKTRLGNE